MNPFVAVRDDKFAMRPFATLLRTLVLFLIVFRSTETFQIGHGYILKT